METIMTEELRIFSVLLGPTGTEFSIEALECRRKAVLAEVFALIPPVRYLMDLTITAKFIDENNQFSLAFYLVESIQMEINFDSNKKSAQISALVRMTIEAQKLRDAAEYGQIKIGDLTHLASTASQFSDGREPFDLNEDERALWQLMCSNRNKSLRISFPDEDIIYQFPDIPVYVPESGTRFIRGKIHRISASKAELSNITEIPHGDGEGDLYKNPLPKKLGLHCPINLELATYWPLLHAAVDCRITIEAEVQVALRAGNQAPSFLELIKISNLDTLRENFALWINRLL